MSKTIEYLIIFGVGVAAGILSTKSYFENKYKKIADDEIDSVREVYSQRKKPINSDISEKNTSKAEETPKKIPNYDMESVVYGYSTHSIAEEPTDYHKFYEKDQEEEILEIKMAEKEAPKEEDRPYLITEEEYSETELTFDKMSCTFYVPDQILVDDLSHESVEPYVFGEENTDFLINSKDKFIYIRNEKLGCDLEISKNYNSIEESGDRVWFG